MKDLKPSPYAQKSGNRLATPPPMISVAEQTSRTAPPATANLSQIDLCRRNNQRNIPPTKRQRGVREFVKSSAIRHNPRGHNQKAPCHSRCCREVTHKPDASMAPSPIKVAV